MNKDQGDRDSYGLEPAVSFGTVGSAADQSGVAGAIEFDAFCRRCGYQLRGLARSAVCPECGTPAAQSLLGDRLAFSSPEYVKHLLTGAGMVLNAILLWIVAAVLGVFAGMLVRNYSAPPSTTHFVQLLGYAAMVMGTIGMWMFSAPDPALEGRDAAIKSRKLVRSSVIASVLLSLCGFILSALGIGSTTPGAAVGQLGAGQIAASALGIVSLIAFAVSYFAQMRYVRWLAGRIPNQWVIGRAKLLMWLGPALFIVGPVVGMAIPIVLLFVRTSGSLSPVALIGVLIGMALCPLIAIVMYWNMLDRVRKDLKAIMAAQRA